MNNDDLELILKALVIFGAAIISIYQSIQSRRQLSNVVSRPRQRLKTDLEILTLIDDHSDSNYQSVKTNVDKLIQTVYQPVRREKKHRIRVYVLVHLSVGLLFLVGFGIWTIYILKDGFSWWAVFTGYLAVGGLGNILLAFKYKKESSCLFSLKNVPGNDSERLLKFLKDDLNIGWAENAEISKSKDGKTIRIFKDENLAEITIDEEKEKATLKISDVRTYDLKVKKENGKLEISF